FRSDADLLARAGGRLCSREQLGDLEPFAQRKATQSPMVGVRQWGGACHRKLLCAPIPSSSAHRARQYLYRIGSAAVGTACLARVRLEAACGIPRQAQGTGLLRSSPWWV